MTKIPKHLASSCFFLILSIYILYCLYYIHLKTPNKKKLCNNYSGYDTIIQAKERERLGFAINPEFQIIPKSYNDTLEQLKTKVLKSQSERSSTQIQNEFLNSFFPPPKPLRVLIEFTSGWGGNTNEKNCKRSKNPKYSCTFTYFAKLKNINRTRKLKINDVAGNYDAVFVYRDFLHKNHIQLNSDATYIERNQTIPKLIYFTPEHPAPLNEWQMTVKMDGRSGRSILASYWRGSDIYTPYFIWSYYDPRVTEKYQEKNYAKGRTKMAAIIVSNCLPNNNRLGFVQELRRYFKVDTFGKCGKTECRVKDCIPNIRKNYKFYLSFENSNCRDYVTEKLLKGYNNNLLPIVMGAHPVDYKAIAPRNSYIHVEDFDSVDMLAQYMLRLDKDDILYNSYFAWKGTGEFKTYGGGVMCEICSYLHAQRILEVQEQDIQVISGYADQSDLDSVPLPYFNTKDTYDFKYFNFSNNDTRLCLKSNSWYWNK